MDFIIAVCVVVVGHAAINLLGRLHNLISSTLSEAARAIARSAYRDEIADLERQLNEASQRNYVLERKQTVIIRRMRQLETLVSELMEAGTEALKSSEAKPEYNPKRRQVKL